VPLQRFYWSGDALHVAFEKVWCVVVGSKGAYAAGGQLHSCCQLLRWHPLDPGCLMVEVCCWNQTLVHPGGDGGRQGSKGMEHLVSAATGTFHFCLLACCMVCYVQIASGESWWAEMCCQGQTWVHPGGGWGRLVQGSKGMGHVVSAIGMSQLNVCTAHQPAQADYKFTRHPCHKAVHHVLTTLRANIRCMRLQSPLTLLFQQ
jgi:hypothetical protein